MTDARLCMCGSRMDDLEEHGPDGNHAPVERPIPWGHDEHCEADWGAEGQENPCRCDERFREALRTALEGLGTLSNQQVVREMQYDWTCELCGWHTEDRRVEAHICPYVLQGRPLKLEPSEWHWAVIRAGGITMAQGYCRCDGSGKHFIERS